MIANVLLVTLSLVAGWLVLFPVRRRLGAPLYHLAAYPIGTLAWTAVFSVTTVVGARPTWPWVALGLALFAALAYAIGWSVNQWRFDLDEWLGYASFGAGFVALAVFFAWLRATIGGFDSYTHYDISGIYLFDTGAMSGVLVGSRNLLVPAIHAVTRILGGDWTYVAYPMFSANALALLAWACWAQAFRSATVPMRVLGTALTVGAVAFVPNWYFHSFFVHSNMVSALYLMLAVVALARATGAIGEVDERDSTAGVIVSGLAFAGLGLARPDGLAYTFLGLLGFAVCLAMGRYGRRTALLGGVALLVPQALVYSAAFARIGIWGAEGKLRGSWALALLVLTVIAIALTQLAPFVRRLPLMASPDAVLRLVVLGNVLAISLLAYQQDKRFTDTAANMLKNLLSAGGWGFMWYALLLAIAVSLLFPVRWSGSEWNWTLLYLVAQFFFIAFVLHGIVHVGRVAKMDSFNRVALHVVPVMFWYAAAYVGALTRVAAPTTTPAE